MAELSLTTISCGIHQLSSVEGCTPEYLVKLITEKFKNFNYSKEQTNSVWLNSRGVRDLKTVYPPCMLLFSHVDQPRDTKKEKNGATKLFEYINEHSELGVCTKAAVAPNTNSVNTIALYVWTLNPEWIVSFWRAKNPAYYKLLKNKNTENDRHEDDDQTAEEF